MEQKQLANEASVASRVEWYTADADGDNALLRRNPPSPHHGR